MEITSISRLRLLHPICRDKAIQAYNEAVQATPKGVHPFIDQTYRTFEESDKLYQQGRTTPGSIVSNAKAGQSYHNYGCALDFHLQVDGKDIWDENNPYWKVVVNIFKKHGFSWGGDFPGKFKDYPHLEYTNGVNWREMLAKHNNKDYIEGTEYINLA
jgi:hypothetical protein